jgi:hypothetical protein
MFVRACTDYLDVIRGLRERADQLQISRESIDDLSGLSDGYAAKLLSLPPVKVIGFMSMAPLFEALGLRLVLIEDTEHTAKTLAKRTPRVEGHVRHGHVRRKPDITRSLAAIPPVETPDGVSAQEIEQTGPASPAPPVVSRAHLRVVQSKPGRYIENGR